MAELENSISCAIHLSVTNYHHGSYRQPEMRTILAYHHTTATKNEYFVLQIKSAGLL